MHVFTIRCVGRRSLRAIAVFAVAGVGLAFAVVILACAVDDPEVGAAGVEDHRERALV